MAIRCPDNLHYCDNATISRGLCVKDPEDCTTRTNTFRTVPIIPENIKGKSYGYTEGPELGRNCYFPFDKLKLDYTVTFSDDDRDVDDVPDTFSCLTYNMWGLAKNPKTQKLFKLRANLLKETIGKVNADLVCLQEMSKFSYGELKHFIRKYKFASEIPYPHPEGTPLTVAGRNRQIDVYFLSKYKPKALHVYGFPGVLGYHNCFMIIEFRNLIIFNLYNQSGSTHSPGQEHKWIHYSRCRYDILQTIWDLIQSKYSERNVIICGDFNFQLDGTLQEWPEMEMIQTLKANGFIDTFRSVNPNDPGFTEDTDLNQMRWNQKLIEKHLRYDGIFYKGNLWTPKVSKVIGQEYICLNKEDSEWFIKNISDVKDENLHELAYCSPNDSSEKLIPINPSDHFGVITYFSKQAGGFFKKKQRRKQITKKYRKNIKKIKNTRNTKKQTI